jgi:hypothetical protein
MAWIREPSNLCKIAVQDYNGKIATTEYWVPQADDDPAAGGPAAIADAIQDISSGQVITVELLSRATQDAPGVAGTGPYDTVWDKLSLDFNAADGSKVKLQLPGPKATLLQDDHFNVDPTDATVVALVAAMVANAKTAQGAPITGLAGGYRRIPPGLKRSTS